jgi:hypothetical protein
MHVQDKLGKTALLEKSRQKVDLWLTTNPIVVVSIQAEHGGQLCRSFTDTQRCRVVSFHNGFLVMSGNGTQ